MKLATKIRRRNWEKARGRERLIIEQREQPAINEALALSQDLKVITWDLKQYEGREDHRDLKGRVRPGIGPTGRADMRREKRRRKPKVPSVKTPHESRRSANLEEC